MKRATMYFMMILAGCMTQFLNLAIAQQQTPVTIAQAETAAATKPGAADGKSSPALTGARRPLYRLRYSDVVEIDLTFSPQFNQVLTVQPDGYLMLKGLNPLYAQGLTVPELQTAIHDAYTGVLHDPEVTVVLKDFDRPYFIAAGEVGRPGKFELRADTTVTEAVAIAGGFTQRAKHSQVVLFRHVSPETVEAHLLNVKAILRSQELSEDMHLQPGDLLYVPQNLISKIRQFLPASSLSLYASPAGF
jgi:polysaccharide biosynthesis/export protein